MENCDEPLVNWSHSGRQMRALGIKRIERSERIISPSEKFDGIVYARMSDRKSPPRMCLIMFQIARIISSVLGLAPCQIKISPESRKKQLNYTFILSYSYVRCAYNILLIIFFSSIIIFAVPFMTEVSYPNNSKTVMSIVIARGAAGNTLVIVIITFYSILQGHIIKIGNRLSEFDKEYECKLFLMRNRGLGDFQKFIVIILMILIWMGIVISSLRVIDPLFLITSALCTAVLCWSLIQYSLIIHILKDRLQGLNNAFITISKCPIDFEEDSIFSGCTLNARLTIENFGMIKKARNKLHHISCQVSKFFSFPVLIVIFYCCCSCVESTYFFIITLINLEAPLWSLDTLNSLFWILSCAYPVTVLSASVNTFHGEANRTADIIYEISETYFFNRNIQTELNNFSVELLHKRVQFTACGVFTLDCSLLHSIFGMIVTYLLILLQFKPSEG